MRCKSIAAALMAGAIVFTYAAPAAYAACAGGAPNGTIQGAETCDDGNTLNNDNCLNDCSRPVCGDSFTHNKGNCSTSQATQCSVQGDCPSPQTCVIFGALEICDDGNLSECTGACSADCSHVITGCGDTSVCGAEECDDGNTVDCGDSCHNNCQSNTGCGSGVTCAPEVCDDGNTQNCDGCMNGCSSNGACGNGVVDTACGETCDDGNTNNCDGCSTLCKPPTCGDGFTCAPEECDDGNTVDTDLCPNDCDACGNGVVEPQFGEECDPPFSAACNGGPRDGQGCTTDTDCIDYDGVDPDGFGTCGRDRGCASDCSNETCGDGVMNPGAGEECDNGIALCTSFGASNGTECGTAIGKSRCDADGGICSPGNHDWEAAACRTNCRVAFCGDGVADGPGSGEFCDDGLAGPARDLIDDADNCPNGPIALKRGIACAIRNVCGDGFPSLVDTSARCQNGAPATCTAYCGYSVEACDSGGGVVQTCFSAIPGPADCVFLGGTPGTGDDCAIPSTKTCNGKPTKECSLNADCGAYGPCGGSDTAPNACRSDCVPAGCGDDVIDTGESCDDGAAICTSNGVNNGKPCGTAAQFDACTADPAGNCHHQANPPVDGGTASCGSGGSGACNVSLPGYCRANCAVPGCGDGVVDPPAEQCDNGANNGVNRSCTDACTVAVCGDAKVDTEAPSIEECDDGNGNQNDDCLNDCMDNRCGDSFVNPSVEGCDDGNSVNFDGCSADCCSEATICDVSVCSPPQEFDALECNLAAVVRELPPLPDRTQVQIQKKIDKTQGRVNDAKASLQNNVRRACSRSKNASRQMAGVQKRLDKTAARGEITATLHAQLSVKVTLVQGWFAHIRSALSCN